MVRRPAPIGAPPQLVDVFHQLAERRLIQAMQHVRETAIGRMLDPEEAEKLIRKLERGMLKRPPAPSVKRRTAAARKRA